MKRYLLLMLFGLAFAMVVPAQTTEGDDEGVQPEDSSQVQVGLVESQIQLLTRTYGDSVVLRWAPEDYATWHYLNRVGIDVLRYEIGQMDADTVARRLRPFTLEQFRQHFPLTDSLAWVAAGLLYARDKASLRQTKAPAGSVGSFYEVYQDQQMRFGFALLTAEWRRDLADALAMRVADRTAKRGKTYEYMVRPSQPDTTGHFIIRTAYIPALTNDPYEPEPLTALLEDSLIAENTVQLWWNRRQYASYEIERRLKGTTQWQRATDKPFIDMSPNDQGEADSIYTFVDRVPQTGVYEYRLRAHDAFGDLTAPSPVHTVSVRDITPPKAPDISLIVVDRRDSTDLSKGVFATFFFRKDTIENDCVGFYPVYFHEKNTNGEWRRLTDRMLNPTDTTLTVDVTGFAAGMVATAAVDTAGNVGYSLARMLRLVDVRPPGVPRNLRAAGNASEGTVTLTWDAPEGDDDISSYEVAFANNTTHRFVLATGDRLQECRFVDTLDMTVNQKYIYYKVRAIDYSSNEGPYTEVLQVIRPTLLPPAAAYIDTSVVDDRGIHQVWVVSNEHFVARHNVLRKLEKAREWTLLAVCDADSVSQHGSRLRITDVPPYTREDRYVYAIETVSFSDVSTTSLAVSVRWEGDVLFQFPIRLYGQYLAKEKETRLAWEVDGVPPYPGNWYYCIYRRGPKDDRPKFLMTAEPGEQTHSDWLLRPGEEATYYVKVKYKDGRESQPSNTVTVRRQKIEH